MNEGDDILVQVVKDPMGTKGARLTTFVALPSRLMVYMPRGDGIGVSARIEDEAERTRLKQLVTEAVPQKRSGGYIVRTAAQGATAEADPRGHPVPRPPVAARARNGAARLGRPARVRGPAAAHAHPARRAGARRRSRAGRQCAGARAHAGIRRELHAGQHHQHRAVHRASGRSSTCTASRRRSARRWSAAST